MKRVVIESDSFIEATHVDAKKKFSTNLPKLF